MLVLTTWSSTPHPSECLANFTVFVGSRVSDTGHSPWSNGGTAQHTYLREEVDDKPGAIDRSDAIVSPEQLYRWDSSAAG